MSGQTHLINDGSLLILEALQELGWATVADIAEALASADGPAAAELNVMVEDGLKSFLPAGLVLATQ